MNEYFRTSCCVDGIDVPEADWGVQKGWKAPKKEKEILQADFEETGRNEQPHFENHPRQKGTSNWFIRNTSEYAKGIE